MWLFIFATLRLVLASGSKEGCALDAQGRCLAKDSVLLQARITTQKLDRDAASVAARRRRRSKAALLHRRRTARPLKKKQPPAPPAPRPAAKDLAAAVPWRPQEGIMAGVMPGIERPKLILGMDTDYPPYAYLPEISKVHDASDMDSVVGVGADMIRGMARHCGFDVSVIQVHWSDCWGHGEIGQGLLNGWYHGCMTYTHATGVRNRYLEWTGSWAKPNKPSGLIVRLENGKPAFDGNDDLSGKVIVDVTGWAPTADTIYFSKNRCTEKKYNNFTIVQGDDLKLDREKEARGANDRGLLAVLEKKADAMWIYGDQADHYQCEPGQHQEKWNCDLWRGFGKTFAYVQSGMFGWMYNGTTIAMAKKGSGVASFLDNCFEKFRHTKEFYEVCKKNHGHNPPHNELSTCIPNKYMREDPKWREWTIDEEPFMFATHKHTEGCHTGYCPCPANDKSGGKPHHQGLRRRRSRRH